MYMARAGYPPDEGIEMWNRMRAATGPKLVPAFLSTHPGHNNRKKNLREWLPAAEKRFKRNRKKLKMSPKSPLW
jgi:predicted Zn-dependent protease